MMGGKQLQLIRAIGFVILLIAVWSLFDWSKPSPETVTGKYRLMDLIVRSASVPGRAREDDQPSF
jgi:hypothetical protein